MSDIVDEDIERNTSGHLPFGTLIAGRYEIQRAIGTGGMGVVYLAIDRVLGGEPLAIKILRSDFVHDAIHTRRFLREVQLMRRVNHKNVVRTFDVGVDESIIYFTMEFVPGSSLAKLVHSYSFSNEELVNLVTQIVDGLDAIHSANIIHRDLKPGNIIMLPDGGIKIADFGVARPEDSDLTAHNEIIGSAAYMAPETWAGRAATPAVDYYSLGVILYEIATGEHPFKGRSPAEIMNKHLDSAPVPPRELNKSIQTWFNKLILRLLEKSPHQRLHAPMEIKNFLLEQLSPQTGQYNGESNGEQSSKNEQELVSSSLLSHLEELSQQAVDKHTTASYGISGTFSSINNPSTVLILSRALTKIPFRYILPQFAKVIIAQFSKVLSVFLVFVMLSEALHALVSPSATSKDAILSHVLNFHSTNYIFNTDSLFVVLSTVCPFSFELVLLFMAPSACVLSLWSSLDTFFRALMRLAGVYFAILLVLVCYHTWPELRHGVLNPITCLRAFGASYQQLTHIALMSPIVPTFTHSILSTGVVFSIPRYESAFSNYVCLTLSLIYIAIITHVLLAAQYRKSRNRVLWQVSVTALSMLVYVFFAYRFLSVEIYTPVTINLHSFEMVIMQESITGSLVTWLITLCACWGIYVLRR